MKRKITVIGAGISGLSVARLLAAEAEVEVLEKAEKPGGLITCDVVAGSLFHKVGGHVFNAKNPEVFAWFWSHFDPEAEFFKAQRKAKILFGGNLIGYPLENHLAAFGKETVAQVVADLLQIQARQHGEPTAYGNFEDFLRGNFGETLYQLYFKPYNQKLWNVDLGTVALEWLEGKLPMPNIQEIFVSNMVKEEEADMVHATFFYPKAGGSQFIADRLAEGLNLRGGFTVNSIQYREDRLWINGDKEAETIIYTGDVRRLQAIVRIPDLALQEALAAVQDLRSNGTSNLFCECDANDLSWLYIPEEFTKAHRIIYTGNFSPANNAGIGRRTCVVEFSGQVSPEEMRQEIEKLPGNLSPITYNYEPNSYVVQQLDTRQKIEALKKQLDRYQIHLVGRFAEWEYYNMDKAIEASFRLARKLTTSPISL